LCTVGCTLPPRTERIRSCPERGKFNPSIDLPVYLTRSTRMGLFEGRGGGKGKGSLAAGGGGGGGRGGGACRGGAVKGRRDCASGERRGGVDRADAGGEGRGGGGGGGGGVPGSREGGGGAPGGMNMMRRTEMCRLAASLNHQGNGRLSNLAGNELADLRPTTDHPRFAVFTHALSNPC